MLALAFFLMLWTDLGTANGPLWGTVIRPAKPGASKDLQMAFEALQSLTETERQEQTETDRDRQR